MSLLTCFIFHEDQFGRCLAIPVLSRVLEQEDLRSVQLLAQTSSL